jgi:hypothetical protein
VYSELIAPNDYISWANEMWTVSDSAWTSIRREDLESFKVNLKEMTITLGTRSSNPINFIFYKTGKVCANTGKAYSLGLSDSEDSLE